MGTGFRERPDWIELILIRKVTDICSVGIEEKNAQPRFEAAFKDVPADKWFVFEHPEECAPFLSKLDIRKWGFF